MPSHNPHRKCPACGETMKPNRIVDKEFGNDRDLEYTVADAKKSFWSSRFPTKGKVNGFMCDGCGEIRLVGTSSE